VASVREASPGDREAILGFCTHTFDWGDYIPEVIDEWIAGKNGKLLVAIEEGRAVAISHLAVLKPGEGWLEGMRVDPRFRKMGFGTLLSEAAVYAGKAMGLGTLRMAINQMNIPSQSLARKLGFKPVLFYSDLSAAVLPKGAVTGVRRATVDDVPLLLKMLRWSSCGGLSFFEWEARTIDEEFLNSGATTGRLWVYEDDGEITACCSMQAEEPQDITVGDIAGSRAGVSALLEFVRRSAGEVGSKDVTLSCVAGGPEEALALEIGFSDRYDGGDESGRELIFEKSI
jgi:GNAT superfamily N-acetyltransferase